MTAVTSSRSEKMAIGELARRTGVNIETIRYYERIALIPLPPRTPGGRRVYDSSHFQVLAFVRRARELGFSIDDIRTLLALAGPDRASCVEVERIAREHLDDVRAKLADLAKLEKILTETVDLCAGDDTPACPVLDMLSADRR